MSLSRTKGLLSSAKVFYKKCRRSPSVGSAVKREGRATDYRTNHRSRFTVTGSAAMIHTSGSTIYLDNANVILPLFVDVHSSQIKHQIWRVVEALCPFFPSTAIDVQGNDHEGPPIRILPLEGGLSNELFVVESTVDTSLSVLLRIHPSATQEGPGIVDREIENRLTAWLSRCNHGGGDASSASFPAPIFYGRFQNGRVEEFYPNHTPLSCSDMRTHGPSIARLLARLHRLNPPRDVLDSHDGDVWLQMKVWRKLAEKQLRQHPEPNSSGDYDRENHMHAVDTHHVVRDLLSLLQRECDWLKHTLTHRSITHPAERFGMQVVLTHMDCQPLNILRSYVEDDVHSPSGQGPLKLIDYEYAGRNPRVVDIGNTFCEYMDFNHFQGKWSDYPSEDAQNAFLTAYLDESLEAWQAPCNPSADDAYLIALRRLVSEYSLVSHLEWSLWSCAQHFLSNIQFDYLGYAKHRMEAYEYFKGQWFAMAKSSY